jgi:hypothetical protein
LSSIIKIYNKNNELLLVYKFLNSFIKSFKILWKKFPEKILIKTGIFKFSILINGDIYDVKTSSFIKRKYKLFKNNKKIADIKLEDPFFKAYYSIDFNITDSKTVFFGLIVLLIYFTNISNNNI